MEKSCQYSCRASFLVYGFLFAILSGMLPGHAWSLMTSELSLTKFNTPGTVKLEGAKSDYSVKVPLPERWEVEEVILRLAYINSSALMAKRSQIMVSVNGYPVAQTALLPESPEGLMTVRIPVEQLKYGYNDFTFLVAQHFTDKVPLSLNSITSFLFDSRSYVYNSVHLVTEDNSETNIKLAALAASGTALRFDYRSVHFSLGRELKENVDNILIGSSKFIQSFLSQLEGEAPGVHMNILHLPPVAHFSAENPTSDADEKHALIVLGGENPEQLLRTVQAYSLLSFPLSDTQGMNVVGVLMPDIDQYSGKLRLAPKKTYQFKELDFPTVTFQGYMPGSRSLSFSIPNGLLLMENRAITLSVTMAYAANMRDDSTFVIRFNGQFISSIPLNNTQGGWFNSYKIRLPLSYAKSGRNTLEFLAALVPLRSGNCEVKEIDHLALTVFGDSEIEMPDIPHWVELPNLEFLMDDGFPLAEYPDFRETVLLLGDESDAVAVAAVNFLALLSQKNGIPPTGISVTKKIPEQKDVQLLVVGNRSSLPPQIVAVSKTLEEIRLPVHGRLPGTKKNTDWLQQQKDKYFPLIQEKKTASPDMAGLKAESFIGSNKLLLTEFESPFKDMRSVVLVTADTNQDLVNGTLSLWDYAVHSAIRGDLALVDYSSDPLEVTWGKVGLAYYQGDTGSINWLNYLANSYPKVFFFSIAAALLICALSVMILLGIYKKKRLGNGI
jgi:hypothetical protein